MVEGTDKYTIFSSLEKSNDPNMIMPPFGRGCKKCFAADRYIFNGRKKFICQQMYKLFSFLRD